MTRAYKVVETQWGFNIAGPGNHVWVCGEGVSRKRATSFARALERAYIEGRKVIDEAGPVTKVLTAVAKLDEDPRAAAAEIQRLARFKRRAADLLREMEKLRRAAEPPPASGQNGG